MIGEKHRMHPLQQILKSGGPGVACGVPSYCTANRQVLTAILRDAAKTCKTVLIEATANQVNQFGGYTGMAPSDFAAFIRSIAQETGCDMRQIILGGDHLGPLTFAHDLEGAAMAKAEELVRAYVLAGFSKIHLDTSMRVAGDPEGALDKRVVAERGAHLCRSAETAYLAYRQEHPDALRPVYVIGSEVPIPGGATEQEERVSVTDPADCEETIEIYRETFYSCGLEEAWNAVIAIVAQPGVEFGDDMVFPYDSPKAAPLTAILKKYPRLVFEGHSTDYQPAQCLANMVRDGIGILKVGPALTFALRKALFALSYIEMEMIPDSIQRANFPTVLEQEMLLRPADWDNYYHGDAETLRLARAYSLSDRARYYLGCPAVSAAIAKLQQNINQLYIPLGLLRQHFPCAIETQAHGSISDNFTKLLESTVMETVEQYIRAANCQ